MALHPNLDPELRAGLDQMMMPSTELSPENLPGHRAQINAMLASAPTPQTDVSIENRHVRPPQAKSPR